MKKLPLIFSACVLLAPLGVSGQTILIDYDDGDAGNGVHDANINDGDFGGQIAGGSVVNLPWVNLYNFQFATNNNSGVGSNTNFVSMGGSDAATARRIGIEASAPSGYTLALGHTLEASFMIRPAANWDVNDTMGIKLFYTADDTLTGAATDLAEFVFTGRNNAAWTTETFDPVVVLDSGAVGKKLFASIQTATPGATVSGEFARLDNVFLSVDTTVPSPFLVAGPEVSLAAGTTGTSSHSISLSNLGDDGTTPLAISQVVASGGDGGAVSNIAFPASVASGATDNVTFDFSPTSGAGSYSFNLEVSSDDAATPSPRVISVTLDVVANPVLTVDANPSFTNDGASENFSVSVSNDAPDATTPLLISSVSVTGTDASFVSNVQFPASVAAGASDDVTFDFLPTDGPGDYTFNLEIASDDQSEVSPRVVVVTISVEDPVISVGSNALDFGNFATAPAPQTGLVTISNTGGATDLVVDELGTAIVGAAEFTVTSFPGPIAPGASGDLEVTFTPATAEGLLEGTLTIVSNDFENTQPQVALRAFIFPTEPVAAIDFGTAGSPVATDYVQFVAAEAASQTVAGVTVAISSKDGDIGAGTGAGGDDLFTDFAQTTFNGGAGNYISVVLSGLSDGTLNLVSSHDYASGFGLPLNIQFGELGSPLVPVENGVSRPAEVAYSAVVEAGKTYELRVIESGNANLAYISGLLLWGDAVPGGTPFGSYVTNAGLDPATTGLPDLDPDFDGVDTGIEWVIGGSPNDPNNPDTGKLPSGSSVNADPDNDTVFSDYLLFSYRRTAAAGADSSTTIDVEYGSSLAGWAASEDGVDGVVVLTTPDGFSSGVDLVEVYLPTTLALDGRLFARLNVTIANP